MHRLYVHVVWTTWRREPRLNATIAAFLNRFLPAVAHQEGAVVIALGMVSTHIHLLVRLSPTTSIPRLLQRMKGGSCVVAQREGVVPRGALKWAKGYSIHSVNPKQLNAVRHYLEFQGDHHPSERIPGWPPEPRSPAEAGARQPTAGEPAAPPAASAADAEPRL